jgi:hypothetical protein
MTTIELDYMEYSSDILAQTAYISSDSDNLQCYSEAVIKSAGDYSLKIVANASASGSTSKDCYLIYFISPVDLTGMNYIYFDVFSSRTGCNFKIELINSDNPNYITFAPIINSAFGFESQKWDISQVADSDKNYIEKIKITILNDDLDNTIYLDYLCGNFSSPVDVDKINNLSPVNITSINSIKTYDIYSINSSIIT